ncbi:methylated-DNA--[protein]-cysteine S-methyltransferase [Candidatus Neptunochlamydia vexilliferae]|uniref:Methylated-DNA-[protein]-cysteine S-methyltransferase DNA binding domain-containing protein n=1 Tax=Candidatus Neptunichlamydia vexilliferae TaxID=1651774 RepID=A0ABS0B348_9BACT|nr:MGMT family protein [Candidatus Neptunochlamydia vexilliferae]MBF5060010.1 hypothetical protein [Candidatus Neptunochlamydia vexilliferae]
MTVLSTAIKTPSIAALFQVERGLITRITLSLAKTFHYETNGLHDEIDAWISAYLNREKGPELPLDFSSLTPFTIKGLQAIRSVPIGEVASYGEIAALAGSAKGARAIGNVCNKNPFPLVIPCHRIIQGDGTIGGFAYSLKLKQALLDFESE